MKFFRLWYRLDRQDSYLIWYSNTTDGIFVDEKDFILSFITLAELESYASKNTLCLENEIPILHDLDWVCDWLRCPSSTTINCDHVLATWNLFADISISVKIGGELFKNLNRKYDRVYDKLFWGNNLPSVTPAGVKYIPVWSSEEICVLETVLEAGLKLFRQKVVLQRVKQWQKKV